MTHWTDFSFFLAGGGEWLVFLAVGWGYIGDDLKVDGSKLLPDRSVLVSNIHHMFYFFDALGHKRGQIFHVDPSVGSLFQLQTLRLIFGQQISNLLLVYLQVRRPDKELRVSTASNVVKNMIKWIWDDSS